MAAKSAVVVNQQGNQSVRTAAWVLATGDTGVEVGFADFADRSVQVSGTFGGATITLEGSNNGTDWVGLRDPQGVAISFTAAGLKQVLESTLLVRPVITGGAASSVNVTLLMRLTSPRAWS